MSHTPEQMEAKLGVLEEEVRKLKSGEGRVNPFESLEVQLSLESGHTVSARTRKAVMGLGSNPNGSSDGGEVSYADGGTKNARFYCPLPADYVVGTDITLNTILLQTATAGSPNAVMRSAISILADQETFSENVEDDITVDLGLTQSTLEALSRTVTAANLTAGDIIRWTLTREGGDAGDNVNDTVFITHGAWIEYTAFF